MFLRRVASPIFVLALPLALALAGCSKLYSINVLPSAGTQVMTAAGQKVQFTAYGTSQQGSANPTTDNITNSVSWSSSNPSVATIDANGVATAVGQGKAQITASHDGLIGLSDVTVAFSSAGGATGSSSIIITPGSATDTFIGETTQFIATGSLNGGASQTLTSQVTWASSNTQVATITSGGLATAIGAGSTTITASSSGVITSATLTVTTGTTSNATLSIVPTSATASFGGETTQFIALGNLNGSGVTQDLTSSVTWSSSDVAVATIDKNGLATAVGANTTSSSTTITAIGTSSTGSLIVATAQLTSSPSGTGVVLPTLSVYLAGGATGSVTASTASGGTTINCGSSASGATCTGNFSRYTVVTLTATPNGSAKFGGWSANCVPVIGTPNQCTIQMSNNETVGAVFNP